MKKPKDTDYLFISTRVRCLENRLLGRQRMERMLEARTDEDAAKVLSECGYEGLEPLSAERLEHALASAREETFSELAELSPNPQIVDVFRMKYDYHNLKALIKCSAAGGDPGSLMMDAGRVPVKTLTELFSRGELTFLPDALAEAAQAAGDVLAATGDPQRCDILLDRAYYAELTQVAKDSRSSFLQNYVKLMIDAANLKSAVRAMRLHKDLEFLNTVLVDGGNVSTSAIAAAALSGGGLDQVFSGQLEEAAALGNQTAKGGRQTAFEKACDDALNSFLQSSRMIPFGEAVLVSYMAARENEITAARIILSGRLAGVPAESIRERLREAYV